MINLDVVQPKKVYLRDDELTCLRKYIDQTPWNLIKEFWGWKANSSAHHWRYSIDNAWERPPYCLVYPVKTIRDYIKIAIKQEN